MVHAVVYVHFFFLMIRRPPRSTRTDTLFPYTTLVRSASSSGMWPAATRSSSAPSVLVPASPWRSRSEEHTSELQSLMRISYAVFCLKKKNIESKQHTYLPLSTELTQHTSSPTTVATSLPTQRVCMTDQTNEQQNV